VSPRASGWSAIATPAGSYATLPTLLYTYWSGGEINKAAAVGVWLVLGLLAIVIIWQLLQRLATGGAAPPLKPS